MSNRFSFCSTSLVPRSIKSVVSLVWLEHGRDEGCSNGYVVRRTGPDVSVVRNFGSPLGDDFSTESRRVACRSSACFCSGVFCVVLGVPALFWHWRWETYHKVINTSLVLYAEHDFNASTFASRIVASTLSDTYSCVCAGIGALRGPLHGGANEAVMNMIQDIPSEAAAEEKVRSLLANKQVIMGFGHRIYKNGDPRNAIFKSLSSELAQGGGKRQVALRRVCSHRGAHGEGEEHVPQCRLLCCFCIPPSRRAHSALHATLRRCSDLGLHSKWSSEQETSFATKSIIGRSSGIKLVYGAVGTVGLGALCSTLVSVIFVWRRCHEGVGRSAARVKFA